MKLQDAIYAWNSPAYPAEVGFVTGAVQAWDFSQELSQRGEGRRLPWDKFHSTSGACMVPRRKMTPDQRLALLFIDFHTMVVRDGIDPQVAHRAFLAIDEYRVHISPDIKGAE